MATANIIIRQGDSNQTPMSRDDLVLGVPVTVLNQSNTGVTVWLWQIVDKPPSSTSVLSSSTAASPTFTPDVDGTYLIKLTINGGIGSDQKGAAVKTENLHYRIPAASEEGEFDTVRGWATAVNKALQILDDGYGDLLSGSGGGTITGSGAANQIAYWTGTSSLTSSSNFTFSGTTLSLSGSSSAVLEMFNGQSAGVSSSNSGRLRYNANTQHFEISENGSSFTQIGSGGGSGTLQQAYNATVSAASVPSILLSSASLTVYDMSVSGNPILKIANHNGSIPYVIMDYMGINVNGQVVAANYKVDYTGFDSIDATIVRIGYANAPGGIIGRAGFGGMEWTSVYSGLTSPDASKTLQVKNTGVFIEDIRIDPTDASIGQTLVYDGYKFAPAAQLVSEIQNVNELQLTTTTATDVLNITTPSSGNYLVSVYFRITSITNLTIELTWDDVSGSVNSTIVTGSQNTGSHTNMPMFINVSSAAPLKLTATASNANVVFISANALKV